MEAKYYSVHEVAEKLGIHEETVRRWIRDKKIKCYKMGTAYRISEADLEVYLKRGY